MRRNLFLLVVAVCAAVVFHASVKAENGFAVRVNESLTRLFLREKASEVEFVLNNPNQPQKVRVLLEVLSPSDEVRTKTEREAQLKRGANKITLPLELAGKDVSNSDLLWNRLRYQFLPLDGGAAVAAGVISLSEITPDLFEVRVAAAEKSFEGSRYSVRVRAAHPLSNQPARNVSVTATLELELADNDNNSDEDDESKLTASGKTDAEGFALFNFNIPAGREIEDGEIKIRAERGGLVREADEDVDFDENKSTVYISTDKPLYQPGQALNIRGLFLNQMNRAVPNAQLQLELEDEEGETIYKTALTTSRFGIASANWQIPENAKLGNYRIRIEDDDDNDVGFHAIKISRYDLPNFTVAAKPNQTYYLPNQNAEIEIRADYLFGKPVTNAKVRLVRETSREWDYDEQKWEIEEAEKFEGTLDAEGKFTAKVDLSEHHKDLADSSWQRHKDLQFAAYVTDLSTNRTEQRRFDLRVTREAIHVYLIGDTYEQNPKLPVKFYVSTFYADGAPATCDVVVSNGENAPLFQTKSNTYGAAKVAFDAPDNTKREQLNLKIAVRDAKGQTGTHEEDIYLDPQDKVLRIETNKTIYRRGEPIKAEIISTVADALVYVDVMRGETVLRSGKIRLQNGRGVLRIPYNAEMRNDLLITAYSEILNYDERYYDDTEVIKASRAVIYPAKRELQVDVKTSEAVYRPGEEARIDFSVAKANGEREESALGVVVFDKAVEERARTDSEFGGGYSLYGNFYGLLYGRSFGSLSRSDLDKLDLRGKISPDLELAAELLLYENRYFYPNFFGGDFYTRRAEYVFRPTLEKQFKPIGEKLNARYNQTYEHPSDDASLKNILNALEIDFNGLRDPWETSYQTRFKINRDADVLELVSAGADKKIGTNDDFTAFTGSWNYFRQIGDKINAAVAEHHKRTGGYVRALETLQTEMQKQSVDISNLRDRWGKPYKIEFDVERADYLIRLSSGGENRQFEQTGYGDDFTIWTSRINYFADAQAKIDGFLSSQTNQNKPYPKDEAEFKNLMQQAGVNFASLRDGWNRPFYLLRQNRSLFTDRIKIESVAKFGEKPQDKTTVTPVTQQIVTYQIRSVGADGEKDTSDDFIAAIFTGIVAEQTKADEKPVAVNTQTITSGGRGAITGRVKDANDAAIAGVAVKATNETTSEAFEAESDEEGAFLLKNLPSGLYNLRFDSPNFKTAVFQSVPVRSANLTTLEVQLEVGTVTETVTVNSEVAVLETTSSSVQSNVKSQGSPKLQEQIATPRLREYFPETLVWQPELITDKNGRAELKFKLADNLTTWKLAVIGSTLDGEVGLVEKEFQAFMPFFAEHDPPKILTEGDKIALPVVLRNYLDKPQTVTATMANGEWFKLLNNTTQKVEVAPNASSNAVFNFEAIAAVKEGKQRITAIGADASDAIEKPVTVKPDGREVSKTQGTVFRDSAAFDVNFPADVLPRTAKAELKIYPNLMSHVVESIEGILQRPYGCGEQTISSTYPSLLVLKADRNGADSNLKKQARKYLQAGFERLVGYKAAGGGFAYWSGGEVDLALTAYALRFLTDAKDFVDIDKSLINETRDWIVRQQATDGGWKRRYDNSSDINLTAYISRTLSRVERDDKVNIALQNSLAFLQKTSAKIGEPYILANLALALFNSQKEKDALPIAEKLRGMAKREATGAYWNLETNTPFNGWGNTGRVETTALVLQALVKGEEFSGKTPETQVLITDGLQFLFKQKDRYGVWYSTQTTINVLDTLIMLTTGNQNKTQNGAEVFVNGQKVQQIDFPPVELTQPLNVDLTKFLAPADNRVEIRQIGGLNSASAQVVENYYVAWTGDNAFRASDSNGLRLSVNYDKTAAQISEEITCRVEVERTGFRGYGMLLAEIGLPPGAEVDRESITAAMRENYNVSRYDVLPDKVIFYLWAQAGGTKFNFKFKPRYGVEAKTAASTAYDYYNPEAQATLAPTQFLVR